MEWQIKERKEQNKNMVSFEEVFGQDYFVHVEFLVDKIIENPGPGFNKLTAPVVYGFSVVGSSENETLIKDFGSLPLETTTEVFGENISFVQKRKSLTDVVETDD